ncbi:hypothetical protein HK104_006142 [Borealophlyctis nickersoniae]|nr:hypothetical protein HK104_006142 [Borealophlyctis nickersoniae]
MVAAFEEFFPPSLRSPLVPVTINHAKFPDLPSTIKMDCIVSPANSFGLMDGGFDMAISRYFGGTDILIPIVQRAIRTEWMGQQNVGTCLIIKTGAPKCPYIAHAPTMRTPAKCVGDVPYACMWSILVALRNHNRKEDGDRIGDVVCTGLGTAVGQMPVRTAAKQMALAYKHFVEILEGKADQVAPPVDGGEQHTYLVGWGYAARISGEVKDAV